MIAIYSVEDLCMYKVRFARQKNVQKISTLITDTIGEAKAT